MPEPSSTLTAIERKVRLLTRSPSFANLTQAQLDEYINTFVVFDFPEHLRTFNLRTTYTFYTQPYQDEYPTDKASFGSNPSAVNNPLYDFQNNYLSVHPPLYVAGYQSLYTQSREQFFGIYPNLNSISFTGRTGDGVTTNFSGVVNTQQANIPAGFNQQIGLLQRQVLFDSISAAGAALSLVDVPIIDAVTGNNTLNGNLYDPNSAAYRAALATPPTTVDATNTINYATGVYNITFSSAPAANAQINCQYVAVNLSLPQAVLYYANKFVVRPVPDQSYRVNMEVYKKPSALLAESSQPELNEWWQYIAYGAAKKVFEDRMDLDSVSLIMPEFKKQESLCNRRTLVQYTNERSATIYSEQTSINAYGWGWGGYGGGL